MTLKKTANSLSRQKRSPRKRRGLFITFEGGEGAGKSSLIEALLRQLTANGRHVVVTREPGGTRLGDDIRGLLLNQTKGSVPPQPMAELLLFLASRAQNIGETIEPALASGQIVLCDRFNDSTIAYQGYGRGMGADKITRLCKEISGSCQPDITFYLDVDPTIGLARSHRIHKENAGAGKLDRIESEKLDFHKKVRKGFKAIAKQEPKRFFVLDASKPQQDVFQQAWEILEEKM